MANLVFDFLHNYVTGERRASDPADAYQYDEGHVLEAVVPVAVTSCEIQYWIRGMEKADAYTPASITQNTDNTYTILGNIPNSYFEINGDLRVYIVVTDGDASITTYEGYIHIKERQMPEDYVDDDPDNEAVRVIAEAQAAAATATEKAGEAAESAEQAQEILDSIPEDYTQLTEDVSNLKDDLTAAQVELAKKANTDGYYEEMTVGNAEQLVSTVTNADDTPYNFRTTAGSADVGDRAYVDAIVGGSIVWNQLVTDDISHVEMSTALSWNTFTPFAFSLMSGHKYLVMFIGKTVSGGGLGIRDIDTGVLYRPAPPSYSLIYSATTNTNNTTFVQGNWDTGTTDAYLMVSDLTQMFGSTIADYIYSLETATAGAGVAWFRKLFPKPYYAYDAGSLQSVQTSGHKMVGFNAWDEVVELGGISNITGENVEYNNFYRSKNYVPLVQGANYYFKFNGTDTIGLRFYDAEKNYIDSFALTTEGNSLLARGGRLPQNARYMRFVNTSTNVYNHDICINLSWDDEKDGQYEPYVEHTYPLDSDVVLRGIPKLDAQNNLYYDGDEYLPDGTVQRRYGVVDLGSFTWEKVSTTDDNYRFRAVYSDVGGNASTDVANMRCTKYIAVTGNETYSNPKVGITGYMSGGYIFVYDPNYLDAATFKTAMSGVYLVYEKANASTETATPYNPVEIVDDFGTEEFITTSLVPVGHETRYAPNLRAKLEMSPDSPDGDGLYIVQQSGGENTYIPLASSATIQNILARLTALEGNTNEG